MKKLRILISLILLFIIQSNFAQDANTTTNTENKTTTKTELRYYYYPNLEAYFDLKKSIYIYKQDGEWITGTEIPNGYKGYSMFNKVNVLLENYDGDTPQDFLKIHKIKHPYITKGNMKKLTAASDE